ncbi:hypothetical protein FQA39_LY19215 [Lamprigera yunnana]|nr:hypothetical protein FQA39_LY19215 [Lamprigera yunnana]
MEYVATAHPSDPVSLARSECGSGAAGAAPSGAARAVERETRLPGSTGKWPLTHGYGTHRSSACAAPTVPGVRMPAAELSGGAMRSNSTTRQRSVPHDEDRRTPPIGRELPRRLQLVVFTYGAPALKDQNERFSPSSEELQKDIQDEDTSSVESETTVKAQTELFDMISKINKKLLKEEDLAKIVTGNET